MSEHIYAGTAKYNLIYIFAIHDEAHRDYLKIGEHHFDSASGHAQLPPNCAELQAHAHVRIKQYTKTALVKYELLHVELARKYIRLADGSVEPSTFSDKAVHEVLDRSGYDVRKFYDTDKDSEWYKVTLQPAIAAIRAVKEGRNVLTPAEKSGNGQLAITPETIADVAAPYKRTITLRDEQLACIAKSQKVFKTGDRMLWDCKMRFGKTVTAYSLVKQMQYQKAIVVTHRPAVVDGWRSDFDLIFDGENRVFLTKSNIKDGDRFAAEDASIDAENDRALHNLVKAGTPFVYFASMQDLRGSKLAGGKFEKNRAVFEMDWDIIIYDEAHEGTQTELGLSVQTLLEEPKAGKLPKKVLQLSGTPYNLLNQYENDNVYSWDYVMEQRCKKEWDEKHPGDHNPYADLPELRICTFDLRKKMQSSYRYEDDSIAFNFREFFRTWTGDPARDFRPLPSGTNIGDFVHKEDVWDFLNLISTKSDDSNYPFATQEYRDMFRHTFWILPGVKEARAFSALLKLHPVFKQFEVVNVAGEGDMEQPYDDALKAVRTAIKSHPYTITLSCGKLTTGVTVKEWTGVMLLSGSASTGAAGYMQTIFRVQSAGSIDGKQKTVCYAFDFAPDRALKVLSDVHRLKKSSVGSEDSGRIQLGEFLNFCPVLAEGDTGMEFYDVPKMMRQLKKLTVDAAVKSGFDDDSIYKADAGIVMDLQKIQLVDLLKRRLTPQKKGKKETSVSINNHGLTNEQYRKAQEAKHKPKRERTKEELEALEKEREMKKKQQALFDLLRNISIRLPLLIYGTATEFDDSIRLADFVSIVDSASWKEFMPKEVDKELFLKLLIFYDEDVIEGAGMRIRRLAKAADELMPTQRVMKIAEIFSYFRNPAKETVLTPWRVVNMHMGDTIGGYNFYKEGYPQKDGVLETPRLIEQGEVTSDLFLNENVRILEMNSKSGLYPLYVAYSIYRMLLPKAEHELSLDEAQFYWQKALSDHLFVLCQTWMAVSITKRTLAGYTGLSVNAIYLSKLLERMNDQKRLANKLTNPATWGKEGEKMKFDAVVGNPPYQEETVKQLSDSNAQASRKNIFHHFQVAADKISSGAVSLIYPGARWIHRSGKGLAQFGLEQINDIKLEKLHFFPDSQDIFKDVDISDGISIVYKNVRKATPGFTYIYHKGSTISDIAMDPPGEELIPLNPQDGAIVRKVKDFVTSKGVSYVHDRILPRSLFSIESNFVDENPDAVRPYSDGVSFDLDKEVRLFTNDKSGPAGRAKWFIVNKDFISTNQQYIDEWQVAVSSAHPGGQENRDWCITIIDNHSAFGRSRVGLGSFKTLEEAQNFYNYCTTYLIRYMFLMTDEALTSLGKKVPDILDYTNNNTLVDFHKDLNMQLYNIIGLTTDEIRYIEKKIRDNDTTRSLIRDTDSENEK